jgi:predicted ATPase
MGVHTGEAAVWLDDYVGLDVHRAARICAAGHGGQVLISSSTYELIARDVPSGVELIDLGEHRLKDLDRAERLFQVVVGDLSSDFPPLAAVSRAYEDAGEVPSPPNPTVGRERDVRVIAQRLRAGDVRLLTLIGPGGVGKTRLALEAAREVEVDFHDGARFVSLAGVQSGDDVPAAIVTALEVVLLSGETPDRAVERFLHAKRVLLVLDNFEHVLSAAPFIARLLAVCPALAVLATSREPLSVRAEGRYPVAPLALPQPETPRDALARVDAIVLFVERARAHDPSFAVREENAGAVAEICRRVDGLPLAIELAAAHCGMLSAAEIADRLDTALASPRTRVRDAPARHLTLRATIDWSYELLDDSDKACFTRFGAFAGDATLNAAEAITGYGEGELHRLVDKSLLQRTERSGGTRLRMLETVRAYAAQQLAEAVEHEAVRERHHDFYAAVAREQAPNRPSGGRTARSTSPISTRTPTTFMPRLSGR